jgi:hypothetical protein
MDETQQVHSIAAILIERHGIKAITVAEHNALRARHRGDDEGAQGWHSVRRAVEGLLNTVEE